MRCNHRRIRKSRTRAPQTQLTRYNLPTAIRYKIKNNHELGVTMQTKQSLITQLQDEYTRWQTLVTALRADQLTTPIAPSDFTIQDTLAHLMAWQKRSIARLQA